MAIEKVIITSMNKVNKMHVYQLTVGERSRVLGDTGPMALIVYEHYRQVSKYKDYIITDEKVAKALSITERRVKDARLKLEKHNYFFFIGSKTKTIHTYLYAVGKEGVVEIKYLDKLFALPNARRVRAKYNREDVCKILSISNLKRDNCLDVLDGLEPATMAERRTAPNDWSEKLTANQWEKLTINL